MFARFLPRRGHQPRSFHVSSRCMDNLVPELRAFLFSSRFTLMFQELEKLCCCQAAGPISRFWSLASPAVGVDSRKSWLASALEKEGLFFRATFGRTERCRDSRTSWPTTSIQVAPESDSRTLGRRAKIAGAVATPRLGLADSSCLLSCSTSMIVFRPMSPSKRPTPSP